MDSRSVAIGPLSGTNGTVEGPAHAQHDYEINQKAEEELEVVMDHLEHQDRLILDAIARLEALQVTPPVREIADRLEEVLKRVELIDQRILTLLARLEQTPPGPTAGS